MTIDFVFGPFLTKVIIGRFESLAFMLLTVPLIRNLCMLIKIYSKIMNNFLKPVSSGDYGGWL